MDKAITVVERQRFSSGEEIPFQTVADGAIRLNCAIVFRDYGDSVLVCVDLHSKYAVVDCVSGGELEGPEIFFSATDRTLHVNDGVARDAYTHIKFDQFVGWDVWAVDGPHRYSCKIVLTAPGADYGG